jgi:ribosome recycling factor
MSSILLEEGNPKKLETPCKLEMDKAIVFFEKELAAIRTGKAHSSLVEDIKVECYGGATMKLKEIASIAAPDTNMITVQPWDVSLMHSIEKAISTSHLGVNPQIDGNLLRIQLPQMTAARREELSKVVSKKAEDCKVALRNIRKDMQNIIRDNEKSKTISEDFVKRLTKLLQDITDKYVDQATDISNKKQANLKSH